MYKYLNEKYKNLDSIAEEFSNSYLLNDPFPHIVFDNFFNEKLLNQILNDFPKNLEKIGDIYDSDPEKKLATSDTSKISENTNDLLNFANSYVFVKFLNKISGIKEHLIPDPYHWGGGVHELKHKGYLNIHCDFNRHPKMGLDRRINVLIYLNHNWKESYGGSLELWDKEVKKCVKKIIPIFNRVVIFNTNDFSFHGNPEPINCPDQTNTRKSIALYYYSNGRPRNEISDKDHVTIFKNRPNTKDSTSLTYFKKIFWKIYLKKKGSSRD